MGGTAGDEGELAERFRTGDEKALEELLAGAERDLLRAAERSLPRNLRPRVSVSDILQETRIAAFENRGAFRYGGPGSFRRWILGIASNKVLQAIRHHLGTGKRSARREVRGPERPSSGAFPGREPTPSHVAAAAEMDLLARRALASLPERERTVLRLARDERLNMTEIGNRLQIPPRTAKSLYGRALIHFREALGKTGKDGDG